jgi:hypothetical protein
MRIGVPNDSARAGEPEKLKKAIMLRVSAAEMLRMLFLLMLLALAPIMAKAPRVDPHGVVALSRIPGKSVARVTRKTDILFFFQIRAPIYVSRMSERRRPT